MAQAEPLAKVDPDEIAPPVERVSPKKPSTVLLTESDQDSETFANMRAYFASRPRVSIKTREDEWVQINGYTFIIKAGERVEVPEDVAQMLEDAGKI